MKTFYVEINEGVLEATGTASWWYLRRPAWVASGKLRDVKPGYVIGGVVAIDCADEEEANFMASHLINAGGAPATAVKVRQRKVASA